jgi:hypothetical protein
VFAADAPVGPASGRTYSAHEAMALAFDDGGGGGLPPGQVGVFVEPRDGSTAMADDWLRAMKAGIGVGDPRVFDDYMRVQGGGLLQLAQALDPTSLPRAGLAPKVDLDPTLPFRCAGTSVAGAPGRELPPAGGRTAGPTLVPTQLVIEMRDGKAEPQQWMIDPPRDPLIAQVRASDAASADAAWLERWQASFQTTDEAEYVPPGDPAFTARYLINTNFTGFVQSLEGLSPADQQGFMRALAGTSLVPIALERDAVMVQVDATPLARGEAARSLASFVDTAAVDDLASSTVVPPVGTDATDWRQTLEALAQTRRPTSRA